VLVSLGWHRMLTLMKGLGAHLSARQHATPESTERQTAPAPAAEKPQGTEVWEPGEKPRRNRFLKPKIAMYL
jgi:hypothetical protein